jgi:hypothetical protein
LDLSDAAARAMSQHTRDNTQNRHGSHEYTLEQYGLTRDAVTARFAAYMDRFELRP